MNAIGSVPLDTSVVVDYLRRDPILHQNIDRDDVYLPLVVLGELLYGAYKSSNPAKALAQVQEFYRGCFRPQLEHFRVVSDLKAASDSSNR
ncbi:MAG TPA: PIN domain-containing protein [Bryobacteraceae bacterium]|jgi:predicted nucleic acid-binding protein|nr:PIN domain-containing protein [Bryobacteraceae bacterium]